jgi:hypothetical protein
MIILSSDSTAAFSLRLNVRFEDDLCAGKFHHVVQHIITKISEALTVSIDKIMNHQSVATIIYRATSQKTTILILAVRP